MTKDMDMDLIMMVKTKYTNEEKKETYSSVGWSVQIQRMNMPIM